MQLFYSIVSTVVPCRLPFQGDWPMSKCYSSKYWVPCIRFEHCFSFTSTDSFLHRLPTHRKLISWLGKSIMGWHYSRPECCLWICCLWCLQNPCCDCQSSRCVGFGVIFHCRSGFFFCVSLAAIFAACLTDSLFLSLSLVTLVSLNTKPWSVFM